MGPALTPPPPCDSLWSHPSLGVFHHLCDGAVLEVELVGQPAKGAGAGCRGGEAGQEPLKALVLAELRQVRVGARGGDVLKPLFQGARKGCQSGVHVAHLGLAARNVVQRRHFLALAGRRRFIPEALGSGTRHLLLHHLGEQRVRLLVVTVRVELQTQRDGAPSVLCLWQTVLGRGARQQSPSASPAVRLRTALARAGSKLWRGGARDGAASGSDASEGQHRTSAGWEQAGGYHIEAFDDEQQLGCCRT
mmetsp:Transcript_40084/g.100836  ORF Transcript_40084/g.100836 Transcript_40084/m.100836 type:complete len:249 (+) Transcript_40084:1-747(+)